jgi:hypothetical protein
MALNARVRSSSLTAIAVVAVAAVTPLAGAPTVSAAPTVSRLCAPPADTVPPQLTSLTFNRTTIDRSSGQRSVTVTAHATDTAAAVPSGVSDIEIDFSQTHEGFGIDLGLVSGTATDGTWRGSVPLTRDGTWTVDELDVIDAARNDQVYGVNGKTPMSPSDLRLHPDWDSSVTVTGHPPAHPTHPGDKLGKLTAFRLAPKAVNTTRHAKTVKVSAGFSGHRPSSVFMLLDSGEGGVEFASSDLDRARLDQASPAKTRAAMNAAATQRFAKLASGQVADRFFFKFVRLRRTHHDHWVGHVRIGQWLGHTVADPNLLTTFGGLGTQRFKTYDSSRLKALHFTHSLKITSGVDNTKPVLRALRLTPGSVDTTTGSQLVTVTARATDNQSGVAFAQAQLVSPKGQEARGSSLRVRLTRQGRVWTGQAKFRECIPDGAWRVSVGVVDHADNVAGYSSKTLLAVGLPGQLDVTSHPGDSQPPFVNSATASAAGHMITLDFSEGVKNVTDTTLTVFARSPASSRFHTALAISDIVCFDGTGPVACSGSGGLATSAEVTVPAVTAGHDYEVWGNQGAVTSQLTDGAGNPLDWNGLAALVTGS